MSDHPVPISKDNSPGNTQHGAAILTALLVVMLVATTVTYLLAQQSQLLTRTARTISQTQATLYAQPMIDWARAAMLEDQQKSTNDHLNEAWAQGLIALPIDGATASGVIHDETALFNLNNLVDDANSAEDKKVFRQLLKTLKLNPDLSNAIVDWIDKDSEVSSPGGAEEQTYLALPVPYRPPNRKLLEIEEIRGVQGIDTAIFARLRPFITALPVHTRINLNTAPQEILTAVLPQLESDDIKQMIASREVLSYRDLADIKERLKKVPATYLDAMVDAKSDFFSAIVAVSNVDAEVRLMTLLRRNPQSSSKWPSIIWVKTY